MKRIISSVLLLALLLSCLISCGDRKYDENEVRDEAKRLLTESIVLNDIFWGKGIPCTDDISTADGDFREAIYVYHKKLGFANLDELMTMTAKTFSKDLCAIVNSTVLARVDDPELPLSRYYQKNNLDTGEPQSIMVNKMWEPLIIGQVTYDLDSIEVIESEKEIVFITVNATVSYEDNEPQIRNLKIGLIEEDDGWKINSPTYISYDITKIK